MKLWCAFGIHRWGPPRDYFPMVPSEKDCVRLLYGDGAWANYPYKKCLCCNVRRDLPKTYASVELPTARAVQGPPT